MSGAGGGDRRSDKVKILRGDYLKIETLDKQYRPFYAELKKWPAISFKAPLLHGPFENASDSRKQQQRSSANSDQRKKFKKFSKVDSRTNQSKSKTVGTIMTRKSRPQGGGGGGGGQKTTSKSSGGEKQCGYCEICHVEYDVLKTHLKSEEHVNFVKNDDNFAALDRLIESGANVKNLLKLKSPLNGLRRHHHHMSNGSGTEEDESDGPPPLENGVTNGSRAAVTDDDDDVNEEVEHDEGASPTMKRKSTTNTNSTGPAAKRITNKNNNSRRETRLTQESHESTDSKSSRDSKVQAARLRGLRWNAPSPESRPPIKEPPVYKVSFVIKLLFSCNFFKNLVLYPNNRWRHLEVSFFRPRLPKE